MSSFGGVDIPVADWGIDFLVSSANKCIQGVPGFSFIICNTAKLEASRGKARSLSLDLWDQWNTLEKANGKWRYTSPTHVVLAFSKALDEMFAEGGIPVRAARYATNNQLLIARMKGNIGEIYADDIEKVTELLAMYMGERGLLAVATGSDSVPAAIAAMDAAGAPIKAAAPAGVRLAA